MHFPEATRAAFRVWVEDDYPPIVAGEDQAEEFLSRLAPCSDALPSDLATKIVADLDRGIGYLPPWHFTYGTAACAILGERVAGADAGEALIAALCGDVDAT